jgi:hypothetical protein
MEELNIDLDVGDFDQEKSLQQSYIQEAAERKSTQSLDSMDGDGREVGDKAEELPSSKLESEKDSGKDLAAEMLLSSIKWVLTKKEPTPDATSGKGASLWSSLLGGSDAQKTSENEGEPATDKKFWSSISGGFGFKK